MEPFVKDPIYLMRGIRFDNFDMLVREAWANWLLCVVLRKLKGKDITFREDDGDGSIIDKKTGQTQKLEHVCAMDFPEGKKLPEGEERIMWAINHKINRGAKYALNKSLVVFVDGARLWCPNKVAKRIANKHFFNQIYCVGFLSAHKWGYSYSVTQLIIGVNSPTWEILINNDFTGWEIKVIQ